MSSGIVVDWEKNSEDCRPKSHHLIQSGYMSRKDSPRRIGRHLVDRSYLPMINESIIVRNLSVKRDCTRS